VDTSTLSDRPSWGRAAAALVFLNASLTFGNVWPTPWIRPEARLSVEVAAALLLAPLISRRSMPYGFVSSVWTFLVLCHYANVTAPGLYGREVNLFWDVRHVSNVARMLAGAASWWSVVAVLLVAAGILAALYGLMQWAWRCVLDATTTPPGRVAVSATGGLGLVLFAALQLVAPAATPVAFAPTLTAAAIHQMRLTTAALVARGTPLAPLNPAIASDLNRVHGDDVLLVLVESYGATAFDRPDVAEPLVLLREALARAIQRTGRSVVSTYVESPTFGGNSWLAHISLLSGVEVRDPDTNARLMSEPRDTMVTTFSRAGYRTLAVMPGLRQIWPEGAFYRFDAIYGADRLDYRGWPFGWWAIPDQFTLARLDAVEMNSDARPPLFVFLPTINTHIPFSPLPPYQPDWSRMLAGDGEAAFDERDLQQAFAEPPDWLNLGPSYANALAYTYRALEGYLSVPRRRDLTMVIVGDHQPPAAVSGEGATWNVPVHIVTARQPVLERLRARGFREGLQPPDPSSLGKMHDLLPILLDAFGDRPD
jgi:hypothetical protein